ncbi:MAG: DUF4254 domain-containing protein [Betaproteobacteria bacterium]|nr:MAG: DUF4254 domain-containing protein [Betaproteobacteria bacterium]TAG48155.1 MAG: DUF4254 domain-containing protein [Betaproteobacteria bacterium]
MTEPSRFVFSEFATPSGGSAALFHDHCLAQGQWPKQIDALPETTVWHWLQRNHQQNSLLWDEEDLARRTLANDADITANKRAIDRFNQARNDATERVDEFLLLSLGLIDPASVGTDQPKSTVAMGARLNSETAGSMIDRMSIMSLKIRAMRAQTTREDVDAAHRESSTQKLLRLEEQRGDLAACLDQLLADSAAGRAYFKVYRQFKMYNDARFNPVLVAEAARGKQSQQSQQ